MMSITALTLALVLPQVPPNPNPWEKANEEDGVTIWARSVPGSDVREVKAEAVMPIPSKRIWEVVTDTPHYTEFMPYVQEARVVAPAGKNANYIYQRIDPPLVDQRDYTLRVTHEEIGGGLYIRSWSLANDEGPPPRDDSVRIQVCEGSWTLEPIDANKTRVVYWLYTSPGGNIPTWIANKANTTSLPDLFKAVRSRAEDSKWRRD